MESTELENFTRLNYRTLSWLCHKNARIRRYSLLLINFMKISTNYLSLSFSSTPSTTCHLLPPHSLYICTQTHTHTHIYMCEYICVLMCVSTHIFLHLDANCFYLYFFFLLGNIIVTTDFKYVLYFLRSLLKKQFNSFLWKWESYVKNISLPSILEFISKSRPADFGRKKKKSSCFDSNARSLNYI